MWAICGQQRKYYCNVLEYKQLTLIQVKNGKGSSLIPQIIGQVLISCFSSREPGGPVKDGTLDTWL